MTRDKFYFINSRFDADKNAINYAIFTFFFTFFLNVKIINLCETVTLILEAESLFIVIQSD